MVKTPPYCWINVPTVPAGFGMVPDAASWASAFECNALGAPYGNRGRPCVLENSVYLHPADRHVDELLYQPRADNASRFAPCPVIPVMEARERTAKQDEFFHMLDGALKAIGYRDKKVFLRENAYNLSRIDKIEQQYFDAILQELFDRGFEFSERREDEIAVTFKELKINSCLDGCNEHEDMFVEITTYIGEKGIVIRIKDDGPGFDHAKEIKKRRANASGLTDDGILYGRDGSQYPGGAGIYCLLRFAQDFQYNDEGNEVFVRFDI